MKKKNVRKKLNLQRVDRNIIEGDRIYQLLADALLSADTSIGGTVAMNYALAKVIATVPPIDVSALSKASANS